MPFETSRDARRKRKTRASDGNLRAPLSRGARTGKKRLGPGPVLQKRVRDREWRRREEGRFRIPGQRSAHLLAGRPDRVFKLVAVESERVRSRCGRTGDHQLAGEGPGL